MPAGVLSAARSGGDDKEAAMNESDRKARNTERPKTLFPTFEGRLSRVIQRLESEGICPRIQDAWRSPEDQRKAFDTGHSKQGSMKSTMFQGGAGCMPRMSGGAGGKGREASSRPDQAQYIYLVMVQLKEKSS